MLKTVANAAARIAASPQQGKLHRGKITADNSSNKGKTDRRPWETACLTTLLIVEKRF